MKKIQMWNLLTEQQRREIRTKYRVKASGSKEVVNNIVIRDGVQGNDLEPLDINVLYDALDIKPKELETKPKKDEEIKKEVVEQDNEEDVQRGDSGGSDDDKFKERESISKQARDKQSKAKSVSRRS